MSKQYRISRGALKLQVKDRRARGRPWLKLLSQDIDRSGRTGNICCEEEDKISIFKRLNW